MSAQDIESPAPEVQPVPGADCIPTISLSVLLPAASAIIMTVFLMNWFYRSLTVSKKNSDLYVLITGCDTGMYK